MKNSTKIHFVIVSCINFLIAARLLFLTFNSDSCKSIILIIIPFPILILLNAVIWLILFLMKKTAYKIYKFNSLALVLLLMLGIVLATKI